MTAYYDTFHCDHCDEETNHLVTEWGHERDSSNDTRKCTCCGWIYSGLTGEYSEPVVIAE